MEFQLQKSSKNLGLYDEDGVNMKIQVRLFAHLRQYGPGSDFFIMEIPRQATVEQVAKDLEIPSGVERVILVNGRQAKPDIRLADKDTVTMFPPMAGG